MTLVWLSLSAYAPFNKPAPSISDTLSRMLCVGLAVHPKISHLSLLGAKLGPEGATALATYVRRSQTLLEVTV